MRVLVCGGRDYRDHGRVKQVLDALDPRPSCVLHGNAQGADFCGALWARRSGVLDFPFPAEWHLYGPGAGYVRNKRMLIHARPDLVIAFPGGRGTANMIDIARRAGVEVRVVK